MKTDLVDLTWTKIAVIIILIVYLGIWFIVSINKDKDDQD